MSKDPTPANTPESVTKPEPVQNGDAAAAAEKRQLSPAAERALAEAEARRKTHYGATANEKEVGGRGGSDPARFGDWEINGRAIDF